MGPVRLAGESGGIQVVLEVKGAKRSVYLPFGGRKSTGSVIHGMGM